MLKRIRRRVPTEFRVTYLSALSCNANCVKYNNEVNNIGMIKTEKYLLVLKKTFDNNLCKEFLMQYSLERS